MGAPSPHFRISRRRPSRNSNRSRYTVTRSGQELVQDGDLSPSRERALRLSYRPRRLMPRLACATKCQAVPPHIGQLGGSVCVTAP
jgi:hypothetical protein